MSIFDEPKIDCHAHVTDPGRFAYDPGIAYHPAGQEIGTADQMVHMMDCYGIAHTLLVQPNSGYGPDNRAMLDAIARYPGRFRGAAIVANDASRDQLSELKAQGVVGLAFNPTLFGTDYYADAEPLVRRLADLDMLVTLQVEGDQLSMFLPWFEATGLRVLIDHCGRPAPSEGPGQPGFAALLRLAEAGRTWVKLSGYPKFSAQRYPFADAWPFVTALIEAFTPDRCVWASDWPYLRAPDRQDVGPLVRLVERFFDSPEARRKLFWDTPAALLGFNQSEGQA